MQVFEKQPAPAEPEERRRPSPPPRLEVAPATESENRLGAGLWLGVRILGALSLLAVGAVHLQQYFKLYYSVPTIGTLFVLNFAARRRSGLGLLAPVERLSAAGAVPRRVAGIGGILLSPPLMLPVISERTPLFGFQEPGSTARRS